MWIKCIQRGDMLRKDEKCKNLPVDNVDNFLMDSAQVCDFVYLRETESAERVNFGKLH